MSKAELPHEAETAATAARDPEDFYGGALRRIRNIMLVLAAPVAVLAGWRYGVRFGLGFALGAGIAYVNFLWLQRGVTTLGEQITQPGARITSRGVVLRFLLRYVLIAAAAYVIVKSSPGSLYGLFAGLFLPVAAILCEALYETAVALRRGV